MLGDNRPRIAYPKMWWLASSAAAFLTEVMVHLVLETARLDSLPHFGFSAEPMFVNATILPLPPRRMNRTRLPLAIIVASFLLPMGLARPTVAVDEIQFFETQIRPLLAEHCFSCHSASAVKLQAGLMLDSRKRMLTGGDSGPAIVPENPHDSLLLETVRYESFEMPPTGMLPEAEIAKLERWIELGAPWPDEPEPQSEQDAAPFSVEERKQQHWVWQPVQRPDLPAVVDVDWPAMPLDRFIVHGLETAGMRPAADVAPAALARRLAFDLTGLPPSPERIRQLQSDPSPAAVASFVDELLGAPEFGERWGRHWLDLVRYAESRGHEFDNDTSNAFQYRDYVIRAFNADVPYDELIREHIAGDLLSSPRLHPQLGFNESVLGTGFWFLGEWVHSPVDTRKDEADRLDNMIDVMSKTFLGMTVACARCHDHKFDAISTADYYALSGFLRSSDFRQSRFESLENNRHVAEQVRVLDAAYRDKLTGLLAELDVQVPEVPSSTWDAEIEPYLAVDYASANPDVVIQDGVIFSTHATPPGTWLPWQQQKHAQSPGHELHLQAASRWGVFNDPMWHGLRSHSERGMHNQSKLDRLPRSGRTLRSPTVQLRQGQVHCRVRGEGHVVACVDSHRLVAGPLHGETIVEVRPDRDWTVLNLQRYVGHRLHFEFTPAEGKTLEVSVVLQGATDDVLRKVQRREELLEAFAQQQQQRFAEVLAKSDQSERITKLLSRWREERQRLADRIQFDSALAIAMLDGSGQDDQLLIRGNPGMPGPEVPRRFLSALAGEQPLPLQESRSGRLELAAAINAVDNPLPRRVIVNRVWHYLFGRGLVPTTDDFGVLGLPPTHPELLDFLADEFMRDGQSIKRLIRRIVLSRTYRMSGQASEQARQQDPDNLLWSYRPPKRLEGEVIRDSLLKLSGHFRHWMFGEPVPIHLTSFMDGRGRPGVNGPLDGDGRRSIYIAVRRNFLSPMMLAFDSPVPFSTMGRRNVSNVPAQALILMNDPFVIQASERWARRLVRENPATDGKITAQIAQQRINQIYEEAFARVPTAQEFAIAMEFLQAVDNDDGKPSDHMESWSELTHAIINTKEFVFLR